MHNIYVCIHIPNWLMFVSATPLLFLWIFVFRSVVCRSNGKRYYTFLMKWKWVNWENIMISFQSFAPFLFGCYPLFTLQSPSFSFCSHQRIFLRSSLDFDLQFSVAPGVRRSMSNSSIYDRKESFSSGRCDVALALPHHTSLYTSIGTRYINRVFLILSLYRWIFNQQIHNYSEILLPLLLSLVLNLSPF